MKKIGLIGLLFIFLFMGMMISSSSDEITNEKLEEDLKDFEDQITIPGNNYNGIEKENINPNIVGNLGKKIENGINKAFDFGKDIIKKFVE